MDEKNDLAEYLSNGIENIVVGILKAGLRNPKQTAFVLKFMKANGDAKKKREHFQDSGEILPAFLISSITSRCNLFCKGCYARENKSCGEAVGKQQLTAQRWGELFKEARELGISFILLAGGEPLMRRDVIEKAAKVKEIIFPIFTNGTLLNDEYITLFDRNRNLIPILSIEGEKKYTDNRRGNGVFDALMDAMDALKGRNILFGASITITKENFKNATSEKFIDKLYRSGCRAVIFVEYVPRSEESHKLVPAEAERRQLEVAQTKFRNHYEDVIFLSFPGDEKYSGGCLAAGRGFFHINVDGSAEPCPFSPYSDINLKDVNLSNALHSPLFQKLNASGMLIGEHDGGCILVQREAEIKEWLNGTT